MAFVLFGCWARRLLSLLLLLFLGGVSRVVRSFLSFFSLVALVLLVSVLGFGLWLGSCRLFRACVSRSFGSLCCRWCSLVFALVGFRPSVFAVCSFPSPLVRSSVCLGLSAFGCWCRLVLLPVVGVAVGSSALLCLGCSPCCCFPSVWCSVVRLGLLVGLCPVGRLKPPEKEDFI